MADLVSMEVVHPRQELQVPQLSPWQRDVALSQVVVEVTHWAVLCDQPELILLQSRTDKGHYRGVVGYLVQVLCLHERVAVPGACGYRERERGGREREREGGREGGCMYVPTSSMY